MVRRRGSGGRFVVVGDALLDRDLEGRAERLCPDAPVPVVDDPVERARPGGAALAAALAGADGREVVLVTALGRDRAGRQLADLLAQHQVEVVDLGLDGPTPEKVRIMAQGRPLLRLDRGGRPDEGPAGGRAASGRATGGRATGGRAGEGALSRAAAALRDASVVLVSDYGRGTAGHPGLRAGIGRPGVPVVWDPHRHGDQPVAGVTLATPNRTEAEALAPGVQGSGLAAHTARGRQLVGRWSARAVAVTLGRDGALLVDGDRSPMVVPPPVTGAGDPCGAGDRFAAAAAALLADGALVSEAVVGAVETASGYVAAGGPATLRPGPAGSGGRASGGREVGGGQEAGRGCEGGGGYEGAGAHVVAAVRARGGTVVAAGGCFDLVHAGHVRLLQSARSLGDCLVVCLNSDRSVRRLKGPDRPVVGQDDRAAVLLGMGCVDAVAVFEEDTPGELLRRLRPDVFVKGADYALAELPEAALVAEWGGQAVVLPYLPGRSTTRLLQEVAHHGPS